MNTVLFVCVHNSGRSQIAEAFFNHLAGREARAMSAGTDPAGSISPDIVQAMREVGIDVSGNRPKLLTSELLDKADKVLSMGCGVEGLCPAALVETEEWQIGDPKGKPLADIRRIRDSIHEKGLQMLKADEPKTV